MTVPRVQIHQYNDPEILEFFNGHGVDFRLVGDHLFVIRTRTGELPAGPGDWLAVGPDGEVQVEWGNYRLRAQRAMTSVTNARRERTNAVEATY